MNDAKTGYKTYKKDFSYSYTLGAFPTIELLRNRPGDVLCVIAHTDYTDLPGLRQLCKECGAPFAVGNKQLLRMGGKEDCFAAGVFRKFEGTPAANKPHIVLHHPANMGNLGTIIRTAVGLGIYDLALITPCADVFDPKTVRASMGSLFKLRFRHYPSFEAYRTEYPNHRLFPFMLEGGRTLYPGSCPTAPLFSLVFGNEGEGLPSCFKEYGEPIYIPQTPDVDSLNVTVAAGIGMYLFVNSLRSGENFEKS